MTLASDQALAPPAPPTEADWDRAIGTIRAANRIVLSCHVSPDGDALGSTLALGIALARLGKDVVASHDTWPLRTPPSLEFLPGQELIVEASTIDYAPDLLMTFDTGSRDRLGALGALLDSAQDSIVVDHHVTNTQFGSHNLIDVSAASTTVIVGDLLDRLGVEWDAQIATCLYTGLVTDTGSFKYAATTPEVHRLAARLLATGIRQDLIARAVYDTASFGYVKLLGTVLSRAELDTEHDLVWTSVSAADLASHRLGLDEIEGVIDVVRLTAEAEVAAVIKQDVDGAWKVSTRSKGNVDVGELCQSLGGGGHRFAAGYTSTGDLDFTVAELRAALDKLPATP